MTMKVWTLTIETIIVTSGCESKWGIPPDEWPIDALLKQIGDQSESGLIEVETTATEWHGPEPGLDKTRRVIARNRMDFDRIAETLATFVAGPPPEEDELREHDEEHEDVLLMALDDQRVIDHLCRDRSEPTEDELREHDEEHPDDKILVMLKDPDGATRAWARGPKDQIEDVRERARGQLSLYRKKKADLGDPLATAEYTEVIEDADPDRSQRLTVVEAQKAPSTRTRQKRIREGSGAPGTTEWIYRSEGYTRLARELQVGVPEAINGKGYGVWLTRAERVLVRFEHEDRYPRKPEGVEA